MPDFRIDDTASEHPKLRAAGLQAFGLWSAAGSWCMNPAHLTDGWVPMHYVQSWDGGKKSAKKLVDVGLWREEPRDGMAGYQFHDWEHFQRTAKAIEDEKRKARDRMARVRSGNVRPNRERTSSRTGQARSANVHDSLTLTHTLSGDLGGEGHLGNATAGAQRPSSRCPKHINDPEPPPCGACGDARRAAEAYDRQRTAAAADARSAEARQRAADRARAVAACGLCDVDGYRNGQVCDHDPDAPARAARGRARVLAALGRDTTQEAS